MSLPSLPCRLRTVFEEHVDLFSRAAAYCDQILDEHGHTHNRWLIEILIRELLRYLRLDARRKAAFVGGWLSHYVVDAIYLAHCGLPLFIPRFDDFERVHHLVENEIADNAFKDLNVEELASRSCKSSFWDYYEEALLTNMARAVEVLEMMNGVRPRAEMALARENVKDCFVGLRLLFDYCEKRLRCRRTGQLPKSIKDICHSTVVQVAGDRGSRCAQVAAVKIQRELARERQRQRSGSWVVEGDAARQEDVEADVTSADCRVLLRTTQTGTAELAVLWHGTKGCLALESNSGSDMLALADAFLDMIGAARIGHFGSEDEALETWRARDLISELDKCREDELEGMAWGRWMEQCLQIPMAGTDIVRPKCFDDWVRFFQQSGLIDWCHDAERWFRTRPRYSVK